VPLKLYLNSNTDNYCSLFLNFSSYPAERVKKDEKNEHDMGVAGTVELLNNAPVAEQPVSSFDWSPDKQGLCVYSAFDQQVRVGVVTKL
jgi:WD repeat-containing protein 92